MRNVPVDINTFLTNVQSPVGFDPVVDLETGEHRRNNDGVPRWRLTVLYQEPGRKRELVEIGFAADQPPEAEPGAQLLLRGLTARHWETTNAYGTRSGMSLTADEIGFKPNRATNPTREAA
jgi:hypothetical protein